MRAAVEEKKKLVGELKEKLDRAQLFVLADFQGVGFEEIRSLRRHLRQSGGEYRVFKNTLVRRAAEEKGWSGLAAHLSGNTSLLLGYQDPIAPLKVLVKFIKDSEKGKIKAGMLNNSFFEEKQLKELAKLPSREVLLGKIVSSLNSPLYGLVTVLSGPMRKLVYVLQAIRQKKGG